MTINIKKNEINNKKINKINNNKINNIIVLGKGS